MSESLKAQKALLYFNLGYNCAQSVLTAFHTEMGLDEATALRLGSSLGGGVGGLREVCGAFTGMCVALGALKGYDTPDDPAAKARHYALIQRMGAQFTEAFGTLICRELLLNAGIQPSPAPAARTAQYYATRPCAQYVVACAEMAEKALAEG